MKKVLIYGFIILVFSGNLILIKENAKADSLTDGEKETIKMCGVQVELKTESQIIQNNSVQFIGKISRIPNSSFTAPCLAMSDTVSVSVTRKGVSTDYISTQQSYGYGRGKEDTTIAFSVPLSGSLKKGDEIHLQSFFSVTRSRTVGKVFSWDDNTKPSPYFKVCYQDACKGTSPIPTGPPIATPTGVNFERQTGITDPGDPDKQVGQFNNLLKVGTATELVARITRILLTVIAGLAVIVIIIAGARMVFLGSNEAELSKAKKAITWAIIGLVVALLSFSIVAIIENLIART